MRKRLLESTVEMLTADPTRRPTTAALADKAHVSIGTVYRYFPHVDAILDELRSAAIHQITSALAAAIGEALDRPPMESMRTVVESLTTAFESHAPVLRASFSNDEIELGQAWGEVEAPLLPLARVLPARLRPDLTASELDDLVFLTMGATASLCLRIALLRPPEANRDTLIDAAARMLLGAFAPPDLVGP